MASNYPGTLDAFTNPTASNKLNTSSVLHTTQHSNLNDAVENVQGVIGTTAGTAMLMNFDDGDFAARVNNESLGSPTITGGTIAAMQLIGTSQMTGGTVANALVGTSQMTGGSVSNAVIGSPTVTSGTFSAPVIDAPVLGGDISGTSFLDENDMASDSDVKVASQQSIKAYVDGASGAGDGWTAAGETWTYASTTTVTVPTDLTTKYYKNMKTKLTQDATEKYFVIADDPSYGSPNTTLTLHPYDSSTSVGTGAITSPYYSVAAYPGGFPQKPKASARLTATQSNLPDGTPTEVDFEAEDYDVGANFNTATHAFIAPATGYYHFDIGALFYQAKANITCRLDISANSSVIKYMYNQVATDGNVSVVGAAVVPVTKAQSITVNAFVNGTNTVDLLDSGTDYTWFTARYLES